MSVEHTWKWMIEKHLALKLNNQNRIYRLNSDMIISAFLHITRIETLKINWPRKIVIPLKKTEESCDIKIYLKANKEVVIIWNHFRNLDCLDRAICAITRNKIRAASSSLWVHYVNNLSQVIEKIFFLNKNSGVFFTSDSLHWSL